MYHFFEAVTNSKGASLPGYFGRLIDPTSGAVVSIYADSASTPILTASGVVNMAKTDDVGNLSLYVAPGTYHLDIYGADAQTFVYRVSNIAMTATQGIQGVTGTPGPADNTYTDLPTFKASSIASTTAQLVGVSGVPNGRFNWETNNTPYTADDLNIIKANSTALSVGAWVRQGVSGVAFQQAGTSATIQSAQAKLQRIVHVDDFRFVVDADDTNAFARAVAALVATGGEIVTDPKKRYLVSGSTTIASVYHISIVGSNFGQVYDSNGPGIAYTAAMNSVFRVQAPVTRGTCGGVTFRGLSIYDATGSGGAPGSNAIANAALDLYDAPLSHVENCQFHFIKGSAIKTDYFVMSSIKGCRFRYCGATGQKVLHLGATSTTYASQSVVVSDCRLEVCYGDAYLYTNSFTQSIVVAFCQFEADPTGNPTSCVPFVDSTTDAFRVAGCVFNRNTAQTVILRGNGILSNCTFTTGAAATDSLYITGARNVVSGNAFKDTRTNYSINCTGVNNLFVGNHFYSSGGVYLVGGGNQFHCNTVDTPSMTGGGYFLTLGADYCYARDNHFTGYDYQGVGYTPAVNAVALYGAQNTFSGNSSRSWTGKTFLRIENATAFQAGNVHDGVGTFMTTGATLATLASAATLTLPYNFPSLSITGTTGVTSITSGIEWTGRTVTLIFSGVLTVTKGGNLKIASNYTTAANGTLTLTSDGTNWFEVARSVN